MNVKFLLVAFALLSASQIQVQAQTQGEALAQGKVTFTPSYSSFDQWSLDAQLKYDPKLPPLPKLDSSQPLRLEIRVLETYRGPIYQLEIVRQDKGSVLEAIAAALGNRAVVDPPLKRHIFLAGVYRALSLEELLKQICGSNAEMWKSSSGTYFFADKPDPTIQKMLEDLRNRKAAPAAPQTDPFNAKGYFYKKIQPDPKWGKVPFNGEDYYVIPLPTPLFK